MRCTIPETYQGLLAEIPPYPADILNNVSNVYGVINLTVNAIGQPIVQLRRHAGDGALSDFTAEEITDGTAEAWAAASGGDAGIEIWYNQKGAGANSVYDDAISVNRAELITAGVVNTVNGVPCPDWVSSTYDGISIFNASGGVIMVAATPSAATTTPIYGALTSSLRWVFTTDRGQCNWSASGVQNMFFPGGPTNFQIAGLTSDNLSCFSFRNTDFDTPSVTQVAGDFLTGGRWGSRNGGSPYSGQMGGLIVSTTDGNRLTLPTARESFVTAYAIP